MMRTCEERDPRGSAGVDLRIRASQSKKSLLPRTLLIGRRSYGVSRTPSRPSPSPRLLCCPFCRFTATKLRRFLL